MTEYYKRYKDLCRELVEAWDASLKAGRGRPFAESLISKTEWIVSNARAELQGFGKGGACADESCPRRQKPAGEDACLDRCQLKAWDDFYASKGFAHIGIRYHSIKDGEGARLHEVIRQYKETDSNGAQPTSESDWSC